MALVLPAGHVKPAWHDRASQKRVPPESVPLGAPPGSHKGEQCSVLRPASAPYLPKLLREMG